MDNHFVTDTNVTGLCLQNGEFCEVFSVPKAFRTLLCQSGITIKLRTQVRGGEEKIERPYRLVQC